MTSFRLLRAAAAALLAAGCTGIDGVPSSNILIPPETLNISRSVSIPAESIAGAAILFLVVDPLAPNWQVTQLEIGNDRYRIALRKKRFTTGGDGEAMPAFYRRAEQLVRDTRGVRYQVVEFSEGIDSATPAAQRVAQGIIQVIR